MSNEFNSEEYYLITQLWNIKLKTTSYIDLNMNLSALLSIKDLVKLLECRISVF